MPDLENVITGLEINIHWILGNEAHQFPGCWNVVQAMGDAVELLKGYKGFIEALNQQIAVNEYLWKDHPAVVRCKDCKWWDQKEGSPYGYCHACKHGHHSEHWEIGIYRKYRGDWFCADGELKGKEEENEGEE